MLLQSLFMMIFRHLLQGMIGDERSADANEPAAAKCAAPAPMVDFRKILRFTVVSSSCQRTPTSRFCSATALEPAPTVDPPVSFRADDEASVTQSAPCTCGSLYRINVLDAWPAHTEPAHNSSQFSRLC